MVVFVALLQLRVVFLYTFFENLFNIVSKSIYKFLKNLKSESEKKDAFECAGIRARLFRLSVDCSNQLSYTSVRQESKNAKKFFFRCVTTVRGGFWRIVTVKVVQPRKIRLQSKIHNFAFKNSNIFIEGIIQK